MDPLTIGSLAAGVIGSGISSAASYYSSKKSYEYAEKIAQKQMDFQERMSNTAHQREVADLRAAGLNPILSANSGASTPVGSSVSGQMHDLGESASRGFSAGSQAFFQKKQFALQEKMAEAEINRMNASSAKDMALVDRLNEITPVEREHYVASAQQMHANTERVRAEIPQIKANIERLKAETNSAIKSLEVADSNVAKNKAQSTLYYTQAANIRQLTEIGRLLDLPYARILGSVFESEPGKLVTKNGARFINIVFEQILNVIDKHGPGFISKVKGESGGSPDFILEREGWKALEAIGNKLGEYFGVEPAF